MSRTVLPDCPHCRGTNVASMNRGRKSAVMLGGLAGGISSAATVWHGARLGATVGAPAGPAGALLSAVAGAILAALAGGAAGCAAGAVVGDLVDDKVLNNYRCLDCGHRFSRSTVPTAVTDAPTSPSRSGHMPAQTVHHPHPHTHAHSFSPMFYPQGMDEMDDDESYGFPNGFPGPYPFHHTAHG